MHDEHIRALFWSKVAIRGDDECWEWQRGKSGNGYGETFVDGRVRSSHVVAYEIAYGPVTPGLFVLHSCDNRSCCNPRHLSEGTQRKNMRDCVRRGRHAGQRSAVPGERNGQAKLSAAQVTTIRERCAAGDDLTDISNAFGVTYDAIWKIVHRVNWKHVP